MSNYVFDDFVRTTLGGATNRADGSPLLSHQVERITDYLKASGSGPDGATSYADFVAAKISALPPQLPAGKDYVAFSGTDRGNALNYSNATAYVEDLDGRAGIIGDTAWGKYIQSIEDLPTQHPDFSIMEDKLKAFLQTEGVMPMKDSSGGALRDIMWNAGSSQFLENAIATDRPLVAFVDGAKSGRGFDKFELTTALDHPTARINGYPISAFGPEPLTFAIQSAAEYQTLERTLAQHATTNSGQVIDVAQVRLHLKPIDGYDAMGKTLFEKPLHDYSALSLHEMSTTRAEWVAARSALSTGPRLFADLPEPTPHSPLQPGAPRGPPGMAAAEALPHGVNPAMKALGVAGVALMAHDFATSGHKWVELKSQGNTAGADSTSAHFVGRNLGGALGGFAAGAGIGLVSGSWSGPGAVVAGIGGGVLGAHLGERWAEQKDIERVYIQQDALGRTWTRRPADPDGRWLRDAQQQQVQSADLGTGVEVRPVQTAQGQDVTFRADYVATGTLERQLNWQAARASYELGLAHLPPPQDPYRLSAKGVTEPPASAFETERAFVRDTASGQWQLEIKEVHDARAASTRREAVSPEREPALDEQSRAVIAQNAANTKAAMAARYMVAHEQGRWNDFGDAQNPSVPQAIRDAQDSADTLRASDGRSYSRQADGQWLHEGVVYNSQANRNLGDELEITWQSQNTGIADMGRMAEQIRATAQVAPEGVRGQVEALYAKHGIERSEEQLAAATAAVEQSLGPQGRQGDVVLELMADPHTRTRSADSAIASFGDADGNRMVLTSTTTSDDIAKAQSQLGSAQSRSADTQMNAERAPVPESPELRISALSPKEQEAHQQALQEANRQGSATIDVQRVASVAALEAGGTHVDPARAQEVQANPQRGVGVETAPAFANEPSSPPPPSAAALAAALPTPPVIDVQPQAARRVEPKTDSQDATEASARQNIQRDDSPKPDHLPGNPNESQTTHAEAQLGPQHVPRPSFTPAPELAQPVQASAAKPDQSPHPLDEQPQRVADAVHAQPATIAEPTKEQQAAHEALADAPTVNPLAQVNAEPEASSVQTTETSEHPPRQAQRPDLPQSAPADLSPHEDHERRVQTHADATTQAQQGNATQPGHPDYPLYQQIREGVEALDTKHGRSFDATSERMAASLLVLAKDNDLSRVDHVLVSNATAVHPAGHTLFVVQGEANDPAHLRASMPTMEAAQRPVEESLQQFDVVSQEAQQRALANQQEQQLHDERTQQDIQIRAASMG